MENIALRYIIKNNINYNYLKFESANINIFKEIISFLNLVYCFILFKPNFVHVVSNKPILLCGLISILVRRTKFVFAFSGLGYFLQIDII